MMGIRKKSIQLFLIGLIILFIFLVYSQHGHSNAKKNPIGVFYIVNYTDSKLTLSGEENWKGVSCPTGSVIESGKLLICKMELSKLTDKINSSFVLKTPDDHEPVMEFEGQLYLEEGGASMGGRMLQGVTYYSVKIRNRGRNPWAKSMQIYENKGVFEEDQLAPQDEDEDNPRSKSKKKNK